MTELLRGASEVQLGLALVGPGTVGKALLEQLRADAPALQARYGIHLQVMGITNSRTMLLGRGGAPLDLDTWQTALLADGVDASLGVLTEHLKASPVTHHAVIDCTASSFVPQFYGRWLEQGIHVVTPNKRLNSGPFSEYAAVKQLQRSHRAHYMYEGTVVSGAEHITKQSAGEARGTYSVTPPFSLWVCCFHSRELWLSGGQPFPSHFVPATHATMQAV